MTSFYTNIRTYGNNLLYIGYKDGQRVQERIAYKPELFSPLIYANSDLNRNYKSLTGQSLLPKKFNCIKDAKAYLEQYKDVEGSEIYGIKDFPTQFIAQHMPKEIPYDLNHIRIFQLDIETMADQGFIEPRDATAAITAITVKDIKNDIYYTWGIKDFKPHLKNIVYRQFSPQTEKEMLADFLAFWQMNFPDIVSGWNCRLYDIPYLYNRMCRLLGEDSANRLSPWKIVWEKKTNTQKIQTRENDQEYDVYGISVLDYLDLYKKYNGNQEASYRLDHIAFINLGEKKVEYEGTLHQLFTNDYQKYIEYNIQDVSLVEKLDKKLKYIELILEVSYMGKVPQYVDSLGTIRYWETLIYHHLYKKGIVPPIKKYDASKNEQYRGAFVKEPIPGKYRWVVSYDLTSLYPSLIRQLSIGPETLVKEIPEELQSLVNNISVEKLLANEIDLSPIKKYDFSIGANGALFKHQKSFLLELVESMFEDRKKYKNKMLKLQKEYEKNHDEEVKRESDILDIKQYALKILLNSLYGGVGNQHFTYYELKNAEAITVTGQYVIQKTEMELNKFLNELNKTEGLQFSIAMDTDSVYFTLAPIIDKVFKDQTNEIEIVDFIDKLCKKTIDPFIDKLYKQIFDDFNCFENRLIMKREAIANVALWKMKKRYAMFVFDNEGVRYDTPKFKVTGLEVVSSSTPMVCQERLKEALKIMLSGTEAELHKFIKEFRTKFTSYDPKEIAISKTISDYEKYQNIPKHTPMQNRAAVNYNNLLKQHKVDKIYESIKSGNKLKFVPLKMPNIIHDDVIGFIDKLPKEFDLHRYVDYNKQFEKVFLHPLEPIATIIGWSLEKKNKLSDFY